MRYRIASACLMLFAAVWLALWLGAAEAQSQSAPPPKDTIFARKILMDSIGSNMDEIEAMLAPGGKLESADAREHLDIISIMLQAFPHMFPPVTNQWKDGADRDAAYDTYASPQVWTAWDDFYARAQKASKVAFDAARSQTLVEFKAKAAELRAACDSCHDVYMKKE